MPPFAATTTIKRLQKLSISLSHRCGGISAHSSLQNCFNSATLEGFWAWMDCLRSCHIISIGFKSRLWLGHSKTLILFFLSHSEVDLLVCFGIIVLLHNPSALELKVTNWRPVILFQDFLIECRIHGSINYGKSSRSWSCKAAPEHHTTTTMFDCWYHVLFMKCCVGFTADVMGHTPSKKFNFCLISPQNICPKVWQMWDEPLCSFWSAVDFALELSHGCRFCPVSFLLLNHEHWP